MKRLISVIMSVIMIVLSLCSGFTAFAAPMQEERESKDLNGFINGITELVREYDADKEFTVPENDETAQIQTFSAGNTTDNAEQEYTLQDFQTARLIVRTNGKFNKHGALEDISGFEDFHILQYESPEAAMAAYNQFQLEKSIISIAPDLIVSAKQGTEPSQEENMQMTENLCEWSVQRTQSKRLCDYLETADIPLKEIIVGVLDTGVDPNHEFLKGRIIPSDFNATPDGIKDCEENMNSSHGTAVSSVIVDNTPDNVKVSVFRIFDDNDDAAVSWICAGILKAVEKNVNVINMSLCFYDESNLGYSAIMEAYNNNIPVIGAVMNSFQATNDYIPANIPECISVYSSDFNNTTVSWSTKTLRADVSAPGEDIKFAMPDNKYDISQGNSFATPCVSALAAILKSAYSDLTPEQIEKRIKDTAAPIKDKRNYDSMYDGVGLIQFCNAFGLPELSMPVSSVESGIYTEPQKCVLTCEDPDFRILYTLDGTYPDISTALIYQNPIEITKFTQIRAVAYDTKSGYYSNEIQITVRIQSKGQEKDFTVNESGIITDYQGNEKDLIVPETINGIEVTGFEEDVFNCSDLIGITLPDSVKSISDYAFIRNSNIRFVSGDGVENIGTNAFSQSSVQNVFFPNAVTLGDFAFSETLNFRTGVFTSVEFIKSSTFFGSGIQEFIGPNVKSIVTSAFLNCDKLERIYMPSCDKIERRITGKGSFEGSILLANMRMSGLTDIAPSCYLETNIISADFPVASTVGTKAFYNCDELEYINMPLVVDIPKSAFSGTTNNSFLKRTYRFDNVKQIGQDAFGEYPTSRIEFSHLESAKSLPQTEGCIIAMPSTFSECTEDTKGRNYKVYGTKGTYAEQWANENGHEFIEISQETAVLTQLPEQYTDADDVLTADVIGFNRTYQWYANTEDSNETGTPIEGATDREFNPEDYPAAKYYYCVVTSTDVGYDPIEIRTGVTENMTLDPADYSKVEKAKSEIPENLSLYTDESVKALQDILDNIDYSLDETEQSKVDDYAKAIEEAANSLEYKPADYTEYNKAVEKAESLDRSLYQDLTALDEALKTDVSGKNITEQTVVDEQAKAIEEAINALEYKPADYTAYNAAVEKAESLDRNLYQDLTALDEALKTDVSGKNITEQTVIDKQTQAILEAIEKLEYKPADYTEYNKAVEKANAIDRSLYQDLIALDEALNVDVSGKNITEQAIVDEQTKAIEEAINSLEYKPADYSKLNSALAQVPEDLSIYTDESVQRLNSVIENLNYNLNITEQDKADKQVEALLEAINALEYKPADYSKLNSALAQVPEDLSIYTDESVQRLNSVIDSLNYNLNVTEQDKADEQVEALLEAINALEKSYILGDVNLDGEITVLDAKWTLQYIAALRSLESLSLKAADMNQDGKISVLDAKLILIAVTQ